MKRLLLPFLCLLTFCAAAQEENYPVDSASVEHSGVPKGEVIKFTFDQSKIFPGTWRECWVYVPAQYKPDQPACVYVNQDGIQWKAPTVFDNLIHAKEMPVTIGVFVMHGRVKAANASEANDRFNRSYEYDGLGDSYARFILEEIFPAVEKLKTSDGRAIRLSKNGNDCAIGGSSSGAVCAFTAAWERPDAFSRVFSAIGTYVGLRGADRYHTLVRQTEPKSVRIYMQDGSNDLNIYAGDWWMANQTMLRALTFAGYEVEHLWGEGGHNGKHGTAVFPGAMRYLWKDWPAPVKAGQSQNQVLSSILIPGQSWQPATSEKQPTPNVISNFQGRTFSKTKIDKQLHVTGLALSPDQTLLYAVDSISHWLWSYQVQPDGSLKYKQKFGWLHVRDQDDNAGATDLACDREGRIYVATKSGVQILDQTGRVNAILPAPGGAVSKLFFSGDDLSSLFVKSGGKTYSRKLNAKGVDSRQKPVKPENPKL